MEVEQAMEGRTLLTVARGVALAMALSRRGRRAGWPLFVALYLYPTLRRNSQWHGPVATRFEPSGRDVWLTIDDGPLPGCTMALLEILADFDAKASFFCIGERVRRHPELARAVLAGGHSLGNHTQTHPASLWWIATPWRVRREILEGSRALVDAAGCHPRFFRSPVGMTNPWVHRAARRAGLQLVGWSASGRDGCRVGPADAVQALMRNLRPGTILLLHEGDRVRHRKMALRGLLTRLSEEGFRCVLPGADALR